MEKNSLAERLSRKAPGEEITVNGSVLRETFLSSVLTDLALTELKKQANVCLLCELETWDVEEWD